MLLAFIKKLKTLTVYTLKDRIYYETFSCMKIFERNKEELWSFHFFFFFDGHLTKLQLYFCRYSGNCTKLKCEQLIAFAAAISRVKKMVKASNIKLLLAMKLMISFNSVSGICLWLSSWRKAENFQQQSPFIFLSLICAWKKSHLNVIFCFNLCARKLCIKRKLWKEKAMTKKKVL